jgi:hypothetical protein
VDIRAQRLVLYDTNGARREPRAHELPNTEAAYNVLAPLLDRSANLKSESVFTLSGKSALYHGTLTVEVRQISATMLEDGEAAEAFSLRDLRRKSRPPSRVWASRTICARRFSRLAGVGGLS